MASLGWSHCGQDGNHALSTIQGEPTGLLASTQFNAVSRSRYVNGKFWPKAVRRLWMIGMLEADIQKHNLSIEGVWIGHQNDAGG